MRCSPIRCHRLLPSLSQLPESIHPKVLGPGICPRLDVVLKVHLALRLLCVFPVYVVLGTQETVMRIGWVPNLVAPQLDELIRRHFCPKGSDVAVGRYRLEVDDRTSANSRSISSISFKMTLESIFVPTGSTFQCTDPRAQIQNSEVASSLSLVAWKG